MGQEAVVSNSQDTLVKVEMSACVRVYKTSPQGIKKAVCVTHGHVKGYYKEMGLRGRQKCEIKRGWVCD